MPAELKQTILKIYLKPITDRDDDPSHQHCHDLMFRLLSISHSFNNDASKTIESESVRIHTEKQELKAELDFTRVKLEKEQKLLKQYCTAIRPYVDRSVKQRDRVELEMENLEGVEADLADVKLSQEVLKGGINTIKRRRVRSQPRVSTWKRPTANNILLRPAEQHMQGSRYRSCHGSR